MALSMNVKGLGVQNQSNAKGRKQSKLGAGLQHHQERSMTHGLKLVNDGCGRMQISASWERSS